MTPSVTSILALLLTAPLYAQSEDSKDVNNRSERPSVEPIFQKLDVDEDGKITFTEFEANPRLERANAEQRQIIFARIDKNEDGTIERHEMRPVHKERPERPERPNWLQQGPVTFEQFSKQPRVQRLDEERRRQLFERLDQNGDGKLDKEDSPRKRVEGGPENRPEPKFDTDQDGKISLSEFRQGPRQKMLSEDESAMRFKELDKNNDGFLSREDRPKRGPMGEKTGQKKK